MTVTVVLSYYLLDMGHPRLMQSCSSYHDFSLFVFIYFFFRVSVYISYVNDKREKLIAKRHTSTPTHVYI